MKQVEGTLKKKILSLNFDTFAIQFCSLTQCRRVIQLFFRHKED